MIAPAITLDDLSTEDRYQLARSELQGHLNDCDPCRAASLSGDVQPCDLGAALLGDVLDAGTAVRDEQRERACRQGEVSAYALALAFLLGLLGLGGYSLIDLNVRTYGPRIAALLGG